MSRDLHERLRAQADAFAPDAGAALPGVVRRGRRRRIVRSATGAVTGVALVLVGVTGALTIARRDPTDVVPTARDPLAARRVPTDEAFRRSYGATERWLLASGTHEGLRWATYAFDGDRGAGVQPCTAATGEVFGTGHCFAGFEPDGIDDRVSIASLPPGGIDAVEGFVPAWVRQVRLTFGDGSDVLQAPALSAGGFGVRFFVIVVDGGLRGRTYRLETFDAAGRKVSGALRHVTDLADSCDGTPCPRGRVPASLYRPLQTPAIAPGERCPVSGTRTFADPPGFAPGIGAGPVYAVGLEEGALPFRFGSRGYAEARMLFVAEPGYTGPVLVRGYRVDAAGPVGFMGGDVPFEALELAAGDRGTRDGIEGWRAWPAIIRVAAPGCYAWQIDGLSFSRTVVFEAKAAGGVR